MPDTVVPTGSTRTIRGTHVFNEMRILRDEGRRGFHLVDFGVLRLELEASDERWEHVRALAPSPALLAALEEAGWQRVGDWSVFSYLKRPASADSGAS